MPSIIFIGGSIPVAITATSINISTTSTSCATIASVNIGDVDSNRYNYLMLCRYDVVTNSSVNAVSVGGLACDFIATMGSSVLYQQQLWKVYSGSGTSLSASTNAAVVVTTSTGVAPCILAMYRVIGGTQNNNVTTTASSLQTISAALSVPDGSGVIASFIYLATAFPGAPATTWTNLTEDYDQDFAASGAAQDFSAAHRTDAAAASVTISASGTGGTPIRTQLFATVLS